MGAGVMIMAGGTGGHVFPALAVADELRLRGKEIFWLGTPNSFESRVVPEHGYELETIDIQGLRGKGLLRWFVIPFKLVHAMLQAARVVRKRRPSLVIGMGGFVSGPGGIVAKLFGIPLVIHEQNALPGMTNRWLAKIATKVLQAFPDSFGKKRDVTTTGNPVRLDILKSNSQSPSLDLDIGPTRLLVVGGSLGAQVLNDMIPIAISLMAEELRPEVKHQSGRTKESGTQKNYDVAKVKAEVLPFVSDMASAYSDADLVVCRAGALTVAELAAAGVPAILVPYPHAVDNHQTFNARYLSDAGAAVLLDQSSMTAEKLSEQLTQLLSDRERLSVMSYKAKQLARPDATTHVADICEKVMIQ